MLKIIIRICTYIEDLFLCVMSAHIACFGSQGEMTLLGNLMYCLGHCVHKSVACGSFFLVLYPLSKSQQLLSANIAGFVFTQGFES